MGAAVPIPESIHVEGHYLIANSHLAHAKDYDLQENVRVYANLQSDDPQVPFVGVGCVNRLSNGCEVLNPIVRQTISDSKIKRTKLKK